MRHAATSVILLLALVFSGPTGLAHVASHLSRPPSDPAAHLLPGTVAAAIVADGAACPVCVGRNAHHAILAIQRSAASDGPVEDRVRATADAFLPVARCFASAPRAPPSKV